jgi:DNA-binding CsgD family transcriptional regulator
VTSEPPHRPRGGREILTDIAQLSQQSRDHLGLGQVATGDLFADASRVESVLQEVVDELLAKGAGELAGDPRRGCAIADQALALMDEWRRHQLRSDERRRTELADSLTRLRACVSLSQLLDQLWQEASVAMGTDRVVLARLHVGGWSVWRDRNGSPDADGEVALANGSAIPLDRLELETRVVAGEIAVSLGPDELALVPSVVRNVVPGPAVVVAPIRAAGGVLALLYVARPPRWLGSDSDFRAHAERFASGVGRIWEREMSYARFRAHRSRLRATLNAVEQTMASFDTEIALLQLVGRNKIEPASAAGNPMRDFHGDWAGLLSPRERDVLRLVVLGRDNPEIANELAIATSTVKSHVRSIMTKLNATNRAELIAQYYGTSRAGTRTS